jgi:hypothetical protein
MAIAPCDAKGRFAMPCTCVHLEKWTAILDTMPPQKPRLHVRGTAECNTGGYTHVHLKEHHPQGFNPRDLLLDLVWTNPTGPVTEALTHHEVSFTKHDSPMYETVTITNCDDAHIKVQVVA